jgi:hypothetical protein
MIQYFAEHSRRLRTRSARHARHGGVYVAVLGVGMIVCMVGVAALHVERANLRAGAGRERSALAQLAANSAVELALARIKGDANWRTTFTHGQEVPAASWTPMGANASFKFVLSDPDLSLSNDVKDAVTVKGIGTAGDATFVTTAVIEPGRPGVDCLDFAMHAGGRIDVGNASTLTSNQPVSSNSQIVVNPGILTILLASRIDGDAWCTGSISGIVTGTEYENQSTPREMPDAGLATPNLFSYYASVGTFIDINSIPSQRIDKAVLSAKSNPYGAVNPQGIYLIYCNGQTLKIRDSRIQATLVLISPGVTPQLEKSLYWEPAAPNYPALMVVGDLNMNWDGGVVLSETILLTNFNPVGTPYLTSQDADTLDVYPGVIKGLVYVSGDLTITKTCVLEGNVVAAGTIDSSANVNLTYNAAARDYPPPGFGKGPEMRIVPGSWRRTVRP